MDKNNFYAIQVIRGEEESVKRLIESFKLDYVEEVFVPKVKRVKSFKGLKKLTDEIMFKGYVIVKCLDPKALYVKLSFVPTLTKILGKEHSSFFPIYEEEVKFLNLLLNDKKEVEVSTGYIVNEKVIVTSGPLAGQEGIIKKIDRHKKMCVIEVNFFGNITSCSLGLEIINKI